MDLLQQPVQPKGLQRKTYEIPDCPICLEELIQDLVCAPCGHVFHSICLFQNFESSSQCPCCRKRMTRANVSAMTYNLKCNDEAEEQIQAFYNSLSENERQNVIEIMNKFETQTREFTSIKRHRDELVILSREQSDKLHFLEKQEKELSQSNKKLQGQKEQLSQRVNLQELKMKDLQSLHDSDLKTIDDLKKNLSELRHIQMMKDKLDQGGTNEDRLIEDIKKNRSLEEQARKFYEMLRMKKGSCEELKQENKSLQSQIKSIQVDLESYKGEVKFKNGKLSEQNELIARLQDKVKRITETFVNSKKFYLDKISKLNSQISTLQNGQNRISGISNYQIDDETSNFSNFSLDNGDFRQRNSSSFSNNDLASIQNPFSIQDNQKNSIQQQDEINSIQNIQQVQENKQKDITLSSIINQNSNSIGFQKENIAKENNNQNPSISQKRTFDSTFNIDQFKMQKLPKYESTISKSAQIPSISLKSKPEQTQNNDIQTGGQGLFGMAMSKNSFLNKNQTFKSTQSQQLNQQNQKQQSITTINDFFSKIQKSK